MIDRYLILGVVLRHHLLRIYLILLLVQWNDIFFRDSCDISIFASLARPEWSSPSFLCSSLDCNSDAPIRDRVE